MFNPSTLEETYDNCLTEGILLPVEDIKIDAIKSMCISADEASAVMKTATKDHQWNTAYKLAYDSIHTLAQALLLFDKVKSANHQCLFACLCIKHPELELDWGFFEKIRTKRNGICYDAKLASEKDFKEIELQLQLYASAIRKEIEKKEKNN